METFTTHLLENEVPEISVEEDNITDNTECIKNTNNPYTMGDTAFIKD